MANVDDKISKTIEDVKKQDAQPAASAVLAEGTLAEMVYRPEENRTLFCVSTDGEIRYETNLMVNGQRLVPYSPRNNLLTNEVVLFPSEPSEYESEEELVENIRMITRSVV